MSALRGMVASVLLILFPGWLFAADASAAMLYTKGGAWVNGANVPRSSSAIFSGDLLQTRSDSFANINEPGSTITILSDSLVQFDAASLRIEHGGVTVLTSRGVVTKAGDVKVAPASNQWTEFDVTDVDGTVRIAARKGDLTISDGDEVVTLAQGQETTRDESSDADKDRKKKKRAAAAAIPAAGGGIMNSPFVLGIGAAAIVGVTTWVLLQNDNPASPAKP